jgi:enterochelin esterase-like enzyme
VVQPILRGEQVLEPQGIAFFIILMVIFGALVAWIIFTKQLVFRVLAACLAFIPAMLFGVAAVNKYYDYYQSWGAIAADFSNQGVATLPKVPQLNRSNRQIDTALGLPPNLRTEAQQTGYLFQTQVSAPKIKVSRTVFIYLPPQYFQAKYAHYRFPVIELLHGSPGNPQQWVNVMNVLPTLDDLLASHQADPAVLVMPDTDGSERHSLQCLNAIGGIQDATYVSVAVPDYVAGHLRVQPPGRAWGMAGLSEGGFCAANLALQYPARYGYTAIMSGYFAPLADQVPKDKRPDAPIVYRNPFPHDKAALKRNTPGLYINRIPAGTALPQFWLSAGLDDPQDVQAAESFKQQLQLHQAVVPLVLIPGASHNATAWRGALRPMFIWMTPQLAHQAQIADAALAARQRAAQKAKARTAKKSLHPGPIGSALPRK